MSPAEIRERIAKLLRVTQARGATAGEEANAQTAIQTLRAKLPKEAGDSADGPQFYFQSRGAKNIPPKWNEWMNMVFGGGLGGYQQYDQEKETLRADNARLRTVISNLESRLAASVHADETWQALREEIVRILKQKGGLSG